MHEVPVVIGLNDIGKRRHRCSVQAGHEDAIEVIVRASTLESRVVPAIGKVIRTNWLIFAVGQRRCRGSVSASLLPMTLPALHLLEQFSTVRNALRCDGWLRRNLDRVSRLLALPTRREG